MVTGEIIEEIILDPNKEDLQLISEKNLDGKEIDCSGKIILPGIIDIHAHLRDLGQSYKETFLSGSQAAAFSGITTVFNMPNTIPPSTTKERVENWMNKARDKIYVDVGFISGVPEKIDVEEMKKIKELGILGFKIYPLKPLTNINWTKPDNMIKLLSFSARYEKPIFIHADWPLSESSKLKIIKKGRLKGWSNLRIQDKLHPIKNELKFIKYTLKLFKRVVKQLRDEKTYLIPKIHFCHISSKKSFKKIKKAQQKLEKALGLSQEYKPTPITFEITPHHLLLSNEIILENETHGKVLPPLRSERNRAFLFEMLKKGKIDLIGTDHAPHSLEEKQKNFFEAPSGFPGFETYTRLFLDKVFKNEIPLKKFIRTSSENPAKIFNLSKKGFIKEGYFADLIIVDIVKDHYINPKNFKTKAKYTPFINKNMKENAINVKIWKVFLRGKEVNLDDLKPLGNIITF
ncbi:MAG: dihydroorotase [Promethearchaeota archaeon]